MSTKEIKKCKVTKHKEYGWIVKVCMGMAMVRNEEDSKTGIHPQMIYNFNIGKMVRLDYVLHSGIAKKEGIVINFCPFCGADIRTYIKSKIDNKAEIKKAIKKEGK